MSRKLKSKEEIEKQIELLKAVRPNVLPKSIFGDDNLAALDAQVRVLQKRMDEDSIWDEFQNDDDENRIVHCALEAYNWMFNEGMVDDLAEDWPLKHHSE